MGYCDRDPDGGWSHIITWDELKEVGLPSGWGTADRTAALDEANRRFKEWVDNKETRRFGEGSINGFLLGAEWMKGRIERG